MRLSFYRRVIPGTLSLAFLLLLLILAGLPALARDPGQAAICDGAAIRAAAEANIPRKVMLAVTRLETGQRINGELRPWPWAVNMEGEGRYFDSEDALRKFVFGKFKEGSRNFDVGCFQINYRWHGDQFDSLDEMVDPEANAHYAARFLQELYKETGDWTAAVGAYHSRTPAYAERYTRKYQTIRQGLPDTGQTPAPQISRNDFALLRRGAIAGAGSLVPIDAARPALVD